ncbi:unnamed protein product [Symbiodinium sp. CCMP2456]|nr:unnamed protein product [Symbiodinium sp. CCMP2456]
MGDRFIQLGRWRLAAIDDNHFSISHKDGKTAQIFHKDGTLHPGPRNDFNAWGRSIGAAKGISFGFQFIQIGKFRVGAVDETHLSIAHIGGKTAQIFRNDGTLHSGPRTDFSTWDRPESMPAGITAGDRFVQLGKFRLGDADGGHFLVTHDSGQTIQIYRRDGTLHPGPRTDWTAAISTRGPSAWTCKDLPEMAYGACDSGWAAFGDRFIQLGDWRLAAIDQTHFSISHKDGVTSQIWRADGTVHGGPRSDFSAWGRPLGFPSGITFGPQFIQIGKWRMGQIDGAHFSIAHQDGQTAQIFRQDGTLHSGPRTDYNAWSRSSGPAGSTTFGDRFIQFGRFRIGDADGTHFIVTHHGGQTIQIYHKHGTLHPGPRTDWTPALNDRYPQWHCGTVQSVLGTCTGIATGHNFLQLGEWRLAAIDGNHFTVSHQAGQTAQIYRNDGTLHPGPRTSWGAWHLETKEEAHHRLAFGDRFVQFGNFRMGEVDEAHFSISHSGGKTVQIFHKHGTLHPGPRTDFGLWGRQEGDALGVSFGDRFVQIGNFRVGDVDGTHFSVTHVGGKTMQIFRSDGTVIDLGPLKKAVCRMENRNDLAVPSEPIHILLYLEPLIALIIIANGISIGIQTDPMYEGWPYWMYVELGFVVLLSIENLTRTAVLGCRDFWCGAEKGWNWFDSFVTAIGIADVSWQLLATDSPDIAGTLLLRCFRLVRLARVVRVFRLKIMSDLRLMVRGLVAGIWTLALAFCLLFAVLYLIAGLASFTIGRDSRMADLGMEDLFYNIPWSMFTAFRCFIGDCNTMTGEPIMLVLAEQFGVVFVFGYVCSYMLVAMGIFNVILAVYVDITMRAAKENDAVTAEQYNRESIRIARATRELLKKFAAAYHVFHVIEDHAADISRLEISHGATLFTDDEIHDDVAITKELFFLVIQDPAVQALMDELDLPPNRAQLFEVIDSDGSGTSGKRKRV